MGGIQKIYPTPEELSSVCSKVKCSQDKCEAVFQSTSNLNMHLIKHHKLPGSALASKQTDTHFFCPANSCPYNKDSSKHFTKLKYLKQHYLKVHALKEFVCLKCKKKFSTESFKSLHMKTCGKLFSCTCGSYYNSSEAILTHCKRKGKGHSIVGETKKVVKKVDKNPTPENDSGKVKKSERVIYPKFTSDVSFPIHYIAAIALSELSAPRNLSKAVDKGIQTEVTDFNMSNNIKSSTSLKCDKKRKNSQQTQTTAGKCKKLKISAQTQTNSDYLKHKAKANPKTVPKKRKKSMETQTKDHPKEDSFKSKIQILNENDILSTLQSERKDVNHAKESDSLGGKVQNGEVNMVEEKARKWLWDSQLFMQKGISSTNGPIEAKNELLSIGSELSLCNKEINLNEYCNVSSKSNGSHFVEPEQGSDNQMFDFNRLCNIETQTELNTFLTECNDDTTFTLCSTTETQTTDDFDSLLYSNMCTQTCEEVDELFNFNFVHIETQTAWPDLDELDS